MRTIDLIQDAHHELNFRQRGRTERLARLAAAGVPTDRAGLLAWLQVEEDKINEAGGGIYFACTVRISSGHHAELPTAGPFGCRVDRVPLTVRRMAVGEYVGHDEDTGEDLLNDEEHFLVYGGKVGVGYQQAERVSLAEADSEQKAQAIVRDRLLRREDCFRTRAEAIAAATKELANRKAMYDRDAAARAAAAGE